jgi:hypothetical protein
MATRPQSDDSEHPPEEIKVEPEPALTTDPLTQEELDALCEFFLLLDEWDKKRKIA